MCKQECRSLKHCLPERLPTLLCTVRAVFVEEFTNLQIFLSGKAQTHYEPEKHSSALTDRCFQETF